MGDNRAFASDEINVNEHEIENGEQNVVENNIQETDINPADQNGADNNDDNNEADSTNESNVIDAPNNDQSDNNNASSEINGQINVSDVVPTDNNNSNVKNNDGSDDIIENDNIDKNNGTEVSPVKDQTHSDSVSRIPDTANHKYENNNSNHQNDDFQEPPQVMQDHDADNVNLVSTDDNNSNNNTDTNPAKGTNSNASSHCQPPVSPPHTQQTPENQSPVTVVNPVSDNLSPDHLKTGIYNDDYDGSNNADLEGLNSPQSRDLNENAPEPTESLSVTQVKGKDVNVCDAEGQNSVDYFKESNDKDQITNGDFNDSEQDAVDCGAEEVIYDIIPETDQSVDDSGIHKDKDTAETIECDKVVTDDLLEGKDNSDEKVGSASKEELTGDSSGGGDDNLKEDKVDEAGLHATQCGECKKEFEVEPPLLSSGGKCESKARDQYINNKAENFDSDQNCVDGEVKNDREGKEGVKVLKSAEDKERDSGEFENLEISDKNSGEETDKNFGKKRGVSFNLNTSEGEEHEADARGYEEQGLDEQGIKEPRVEEQGVKEEEQEKDEVNEREEEVKKEVKEIEEEAEEKEEVKDREEEEQQEQEQEEVIIDRDQISAFVNEITEKAVVCYTKTLSESVDETQESVENSNDTRPLADNEIEDGEKVDEKEEEINSELKEKSSSQDGDGKLSDERQEGDVETQQEISNNNQNIDDGDSLKDTSHTQNSPPPRETFQEDNKDQEAVEDNIDSSQVNSEEIDRRNSVQSSQSLEQERELQQPIVEDPFPVSVSPTVIVPSGKRRESRERSDSTQDGYRGSVSSLSSGEMSEDSCRPRSRPKSSHPRKRGQQDTDHEGKPQGRFSPNQSQPKIHKNENHEEDASQTVTFYDNQSLEIDMNQSDMKYSEDNEHTPSNDESKAIRNEEYDDVMENGRDASPANEKDEHENELQGHDWDDDASLSPSTNTDVTAIPGKNADQAAFSRLSLNSGGDRISRISDAADSLSYMQTSLQEMFREAKGILSDYQSQLKDQPIAEFSEDVPEFNRAFSSLSDAYRACENVTGGINEQLQEIRDMTNGICELITTKANTQGLTPWMQNEDADESHGKELTREQKEAKRKEQQARLQEIKAITAKAAAQAQTAYELAAQAEAEATHAEVAATNARQEAEIALKRIEEAKIAAEKKRLEEEEAKRVAEEIARKKEEEERRRKEEEERRIALEAERKGTSLEEERRKAQEEKARIEAERKNPNNWPRYIYSIEGGDWNPGVGLILRAQQGCLERDDLQITLVDQMESCLPLGENEELISNILCVTPIDQERAFKFEEPMSVSIPHCCPRFVPGREPVVKLMTSDGKMSVLNTHDLIFDDIKELKFVEVRLKQFGTMAVFLRPKKEQLVLDRRGGKVMSSVDSRVTITSCENAFKTNVSFTMEVQPIDQNLITELKAKKPQECGHLISTSPLVTVNMVSQFHKPLTLTVPCPQNPALRPRRPQTAGNRLSPSTTEKVNPADRPLTARPQTGKEETEAPDEVHLLRKEGGGSWLKMEDIVLTQAKKKDVVTFDLSHPFYKLVLIRTKAGLSHGQVERILGHVITALTYKPMSVIMRQKSSDPNCVTVTCTQSSSVDKVIKSLQEEGYDHGPKPSSDIYLAEGQKLALKFRGNLILMEDFSRSDFMFCNHIPFRLSFTVTEHDKYAQKGFDSYRGFSQIFTRGKVRKPSLAVEERDRMTGQRVKDEYIDGHILLCEHLIIIPKSEPETPRPLNVAPVSLTSEGVVNDEMLRFLSTHLQYNDWKRLAAFLNVKRSRIQAILRQNITNSTPKTVYDILVSWSKRLPQAINRTDILCQALSSVGRDDLAEELRVRDEEYRQAKNLRARESYLRKAFIAIARNPLAVSQWKYLARYLEVDEDEINRIEVTHGSSFQESCLATLNTWKEKRGDEATIPLLATELRRCRYRRLAREIEDIR